MTDGLKVNRVEGDTSLVLSHARSEIVARGRRDAARLEIQKSTPSRFQGTPNPFVHDAVGNVFEAALGNVQGINGHVKLACLRVIERVAVERHSNLLVLLGEPGVGKTHLLALLRLYLDRENNAGRQTVFVPLRMETTADRIWRFVRSCLADSLLRRTPTRSGLERVLEGRQKDLKVMQDRDLAVVLGNLLSGVHVRDSTTWLRGFDLPEASLTDLGLSAQPVGDKNQEERAYQVIGSIANLIAPIPVVFVLDQLELMIQPRTRENEVKAFSVMADLISSLHDTIPNAAIIWSVSTSFIGIYASAFEGSRRDRVLTNRCGMRSLTWEQALDLIEARLRTNPEIAEQRPAGAATHWPIEVDKLRKLFEVDGTCGPREVLKNARRLYDEQFRPPVDPLEELRQRAENGDADAQLRLAEAYEWGKGVEQDYIEAVRWWCRAADQGSAKAWRELHFFYSSHRRDRLDDRNGGEQAWAQGVPWLRAAAEAGDGNAKSVLGEAYANGCGVHRDYAEAARLWKEAYAAGCDRDTEWLGYIYYDGGPGLPRDYAEAVKWLRRSTPTEFHVAEFCLGRCCFYGLGVPQDYAEAARWLLYAISAELMGDEYIEALNMLCDIYARDEVINQWHGPVAHQDDWLQYSEFAEMDHERAVAGDATAQFHLGLAYSYGLGVQRDYPEAAKWFLKAAEAGDIWAQFHLGVAYNRGTGVPQDIAEAARWWRNAAAQGHAGAQSKLDGNERSERIAQAILQALQRKRPT